MTWVFAVAIVVIWLAGTIGLGRLVIRRREHVELMLITGLFAQGLIGVAVGLVVFVHMLLTE